MTIFVDTNVLLDVLAKREPFYEASAAVWTLAERSEVRAWISAISFNNIFFIVRKVEGAERARRALRLLRDVFESVAPDQRLLDQAIDSSTGDFEDALQFHSAVRCRATYLISRNAGDFPTNGPTVLSPTEFLAVWPSG